MDEFAHTSSIGLTDQSVCTFVQTELVPFCPDVIVGWVPFVAVAAPQEIAPVVVECALKQRYAEFNPPKKRILPPLTRVVELARTFTDWLCDDIRMFSVANRELDTSLFVVQ